MVKQVIRAYSKFLLMLEMTLKLGQANLTIVIQRYAHNFYECINIPFNTLIVSHNLRE